MRGNGRTRCELSGVPEQPSKPARFGRQRGHARHGSPAAPLRPLPQAGKGRGAAGKACARMAATPCPLADAHGLRAAHAPDVRHKARCGQPGAAPVAPRQPRAPSTASQPSTRAVCHPGERRAAYSHSSAGLPRRSRMAACHGARTRRQVLAGGAKRPPETPPPPPRPATGAAPSVRGHARRAASRPRPLRPGASAPGRGHRRPGLAGMAANGGGCAAGLRGPAISLTRQPARVGTPLRRCAGLASRSLAHPQSKPDGGALRWPVRGASGIASKPGLRPLTPARAGGPGPVQQAQGPAPDPAEARAWRTPGQMRLAAARACPSARRCAGGGAEPASQC